MILTKFVRLEVVNNLNLCGVCVVHVGVCVGACVCARAHASAWWGKESITLASQEKL